MIRPYESRDFADVAWLNQISYQSPCTENELRAKLAGKCWVYEDSPIVVGCLITDEYYERDYIWSVTVARNWQKRGIATALIAEAEKNIGELHLYTEPFSDGARLYTKLGYSAIKTEHDYYGPGLDAILMVKRNVAI